MATEQLDGQVFVNGKSNGPVTALLVVSIVCALLGAALTMQANAVKEARQAGQQQVISALGGMYAGCVVEHPVRVQGQRKIDDCNSLYQAHDALYSAFVSKK